MVSMTVTGCVSTAAPTSTGAATTPPTAITTTSTAAADESPAPITDLPGTLAYVVDTTGQSRLWSMERDGTGVALVSELEVFPLGSFELAPGPGLVAFKGIDEHLYVVDESGQQRFRSTGVAQGKSQWAGNGVHLAYWSEDDLILIDLESDTTTTVPDIGFGATSWSPTGDLLWIPARGGQQEARLMDSSGNDVADLGAEAAQNQSEISAWSPTGDKLIVAENHSGGVSSVFVISPDSSVAVIEDLLGPIEEVAVSLDGTVAAYRVGGTRSIPAETPFAGPDHPRRDRHRPAPGRVHELDRVWSGRG